MRTALGSLKETPRGKRQQHRSVDSQHHADVVEADEPVAERHPRQRHGTGVPALREKRAAKHGNRGCGREVGRVGQQARDDAKRDQCGRHAEHLLFA